MSSSSAGASRVDASRASRAVWLVKVPASFAAALAAAPGNQTAVAAHWQVIHICARKTS
jgi:hypothetical protein